MSSKNKNGGMVYSTNSDFDLGASGDEEFENFTSSTTTVKSLFR